MNNQCKYTIESKNEQKKKKYKQLPNVTIKFVCIRVKAIIVDEIFH